MEKLFTHENERETSVNIVGGEIPDDAEEVAQIGAPLPIENGDKDPNGAKLVVENDSALLPKIEGNESDLGGFGVADVDLGSDDENGEYPGDGSASEGESHGDSDAPKVTRRARK